MDHAVGAAVDLVRDPAVVGTWTLGGPLLCLPVESAVEGEVDLGYGLRFCQESFTEKHKYPPFPLFLFTFRGLWTFGGPLLYLPELWELPQGFAKKANNL